MRLVLPGVGAAAIVAAMVLSALPFANAEPLASNDAGLKTYGQSGAALGLVTATVGSSCTASGGVSRTGAMAFASDGKLLTCQSGSWKPLGGLDDAWKARTGYTILPSGLMLQWGYIGTGANPRVQTFLKPFPNACLNAQVTQAGAATARDSHERLIHCDKTSISAYSSWINGEIYWLAIGY